MSRKYNSIINKCFIESTDLNAKTFNDVVITNTINNVAIAMCKALKNGNKILFCGNGGSAADAQHLAAELSGRFYFDRPPLYAEALHVNTSYLTAVANDYNFSDIFSRLIKARGKKGDIIIGLSTSGNSENVVKSFIEAKENQMLTVAMTGSSGGALKDLADYLIAVPSKDTPRIQEKHILIGHIFCEIVERELFGHG